MQVKEIQFPKLLAKAVIPDDQVLIPQALTELGISSGQPVIVLIGGMVYEHFDLTRLALQSVADVAQELGAVVISGGTQMGIMSLMGLIRDQNDFDFPLLGITVEDAVTWPGGPKSQKFLWWGRKRWPLDPHYTHFILTPGTEFGDESPWIVATASMLSQGNRSIAILFNGGNISRSDIQLSLEAGRAVIALRGTGRYADELAEDPNRHELVQIVSVENDVAVAEAIRTALR